MPLPSSMDTRRSGSNHRNIWLNRPSTAGSMSSRARSNANTLEPGSFDMVCLWDVIEHLTDPKGALLKIRTLLKPDGVLLINTRILAPGRRGYRDGVWWILSVHLHHFTRRSTAEICRRTGFECYHFQRYWQTLEFGYLEQMAIHYGLPLGRLIYRLTPGFMRKLPVPYYASQTTALARPHR